MECHFCNKYQENKGNSVYCPDCVQSDLRFSIIETRYLSNDQKYAYMLFNKLHFNNCYAIRLNIKSGSTSEMYKEGNSVLFIKNQMPDILVYSIDFTLQNVFSKIEMIVIFQ